MFTHFHTKITRHYISAHPHTTVNRGIHIVNASVSEGDTFILMGRQAVLGGGGGGADSNDKKINSGAL